jgi:hypothetical protein
MTDITLTCLIIPCGQLRGITIDNCSQRVTVGRSQPVSALEVAIQSKLGTQVRLDIHKAPDETLMQPQALISLFFNEEPRADYYHVVVRSP